MRGLKKLLFAFVLFSCLLNGIQAFAVEASPIQTAFNAGEWSPLMEGHINIQKRQDAASLVQNLIALKQGPLTRRGGTMFVKEVKTSSARTAIIPFEFSTEQAYIIEAGNQYFRFYRDNSVITETAQDITDITQADPAVLTYSGADNYANGDEFFISSVAGMTEVNNKFYLVSNVDTGANTFELQDIDGNDIDASGYTAYSSGGSVAEVYQIASPYQTEDLFDSDNIFQLRRAQSADVLYLLQGDYEVRALTRTGNTSWSLNTIDLIDGPYLPENTTSTTLALSAMTGSVTVTASSTTGINGGSGFLSTDVGRLIRWHDGTSWTWLEITGHTDTTHVTATIKGEDAAATTATERWRLGVYSDTDGWPKAVAFHQDRLVLAGSESYPDRYDMTRTGGYSDTELQFAPSDADGTVTSDAAITGTLQSGNVNAIQWMSSNSKGLIIGTTSGEWVIRSSEVNEILTPTNQKADLSDDKGGAFIQSVSTDGGTIFMQAARRRMHFISYNFEADRVLANDLSLFAEHITKNQILGMAFQQEPVNVVWSYRGDGVLLGITFYPEQEVIAWHRHIIGGYSDSGQSINSKVESIAVIPSADGSRDELWMVLNRYINGATQRYIEYMTRYYEDDVDQENAVCVDSALTYDGSATATVSGLDHLEGQTVKVMVDGKAHPDLTVSNGSITLANGRTGSVIQIGLGNTWIFKGLQIEAGSREGTAQGKTKRLTGVTIRLLNTLGLSYGPDSSNLDEYDFDQGSEYGAATPLYSGDTPFLRWPGGYESDGRVYLTDSGVFPATILAIMPQLRTYDR